MIGPSKEEATSPSLPVLAAPPVSTLSAGCPDALKLESACQQFSSFGKQCTSTAARMPCQALLARESPESPQFPTAAAEADGYPCGPPSSLWGTSDTPDGSRLSQEVLHRSRTSASRHSCRSRWLPTRHASAS